MKKIKVHGGFEALIDDADFPLISQLTWTNSRTDQTTYAVLRRARFSFPAGMKMERIITRDFKAYCIDHRDSNGLNNQRDNLRPASRCENASNRKDRRKPGSKHGFGVTKTGRGYMAGVGLFGRKLSIGVFSDADSAQRAYDALKFLSVGDFGTFNKPDEVADSVVALKDYLKEAKEKYVARVVKAFGNKRAAAVALGISEASIYRIPENDSES